MKALLWPALWLAAFAALLAAYAPALRGEFLWDDHDLYLNGNPLIPKSDGWWRAWLTAVSTPVQGGLSGANCRRR